MFDLKRIWVFVFGFALLVLPAIPSVVGADDPAPADAVCLIGDHPGIPESDAQAAAMLVCDALRKQGISVSDPIYESPASANVYRVILRRLGEKIFVRVSHENPVGTIIIERQITLANIEEMIPSAPRLVDALIHRKPITDTVDMENVTEQEARELRKLSSEALMQVEIFGVFVPGTDIAAEPGFGFGVFYERPSYALEAKGWRVGSNDKLDENDDEDFLDDIFGDNSFLFFGLLIGGRYFFNKRDISPYVGGGLALVRVSYEKTVTSNIKYRKHWIGDEMVSEPYSYIDPADDSGLGAYGLFGIELFRLTQNRLNLELRVYRPFFKLPNQDIMPITFGISFSRSFIAK